jgi:hypothetical protein
MCPKPAGDTIPEEVQGEVAGGVSHDVS